MKPFIIGVAAILLSVFFYSFHHDYSLNRRNFIDLKIVCEEASASGALFSLPVEQKNGRVVFNQTESIKAIEKQIKMMLKLDDNFNPKSDSYWTDKITYKAYFYDDSNTTYPYLFKDTVTNYSKVIKAPTVVVTIDAGRARYSLSFLKSLNSKNIRSASHTWEGR